jgi:F-box protein 11
VIKNGDKSSLGPAAPSTNNNDNKITTINPIEKNTVFGKQKFVKKIIVDIENGDVKTLEEALEIAEEGTIIKLCEGVYTCNVVINKPGIKIEPRDKDKPVYLLGNEGPVIKVDLKDK